MDRLKVTDNHVAANSMTGSPVYVPSLQITDGQAAPVAANGGLSYMSFDRNGDAGTAAAFEAALAMIAGGEGQRVVDMIDNADQPPLCGPV